MNMNNLQAAFWGFILWAGMSYLLYTPVMAWLNSTMPTELKVFLGAGYVGFEVLGIMYIAGLLLSDDKGET